MARSATGTVPAIPARPLYDPKALLAPKSASKTSTKSKAKEPANPYPSLSSTSADQDVTPASSAAQGSLLSKGVKSPPSMYTKSQNVEERGMASMIERVHNVEKRGDHPMKRKKDLFEDGDEDGEDAKKKKMTGPIGGSGVMGDYIKEKRKEGLAKQGPVEATMVDLTGDTDNESDAFLVTADNSKQEVCLGKIDLARVNAHRVPTLKSSGNFGLNQKHWQPMKVTLSRQPGQNMVISVIDPIGNDFGHLDQRVASALVSLMDGANTNGVRIQARLDGRPKKPYDFPGQQISDSFSITLNIYAPRKLVPGIGKFFSQKQIWLRDPLGVDYGVPIVNPHAPKDHTPTQKAVLARSSTGGAGSIIVRTQEEARNDVLGIFDTLQEAKDIPEVDAPSDITTKLLPHQKQALYFMRKRERLTVIVSKNNGIEEGASDVNDGSIWQRKVRQDGRVTWLNVITGHEIRKEPVPMLGGILADVMGMGKTIDILSLVAGSKAEAVAWSKEDPIPVYEGDPTLQFNSKATLLVCPLSTIVNWEEQIKTHLKPKTMSYYIYQGSNRTNDPYKLRNYNLVITTYGTISTDMSRSNRNRPNKPLFEIGWFRIVLDEAHTIRKQSTQMSKAACAISAERRWCLSGTPVQNRLDDLGALIKFLRIKPFDEIGNFATFITTPLRTGNAEAIPKLRLLVDSITLRRLKDRIDLPEREELVVELPMSDSERKIYDMYAQDTYRTFEVMGGQKKSLGGKSYAHVLKAIGRLRMLCVHGTDMLSEDDWERVKGFDASNAIGLEDENDERPDRSPRQAFEMYRIMKDSNVHFCTRCNKFITPAEEGEEESEAGEGDAGHNDILGYLTPCNQLLCPDCFPEFKKQMKEAAGPDNYGSCVICDNYIRVTFFPIKQTELVEDEAAQEAIRKSAFSKNLTRYTGPSTKVQALLDEVARDREWSEAHANERPIKSVVFSEWVHLLDLIQIAFTSSSVKFARLDGRMPFKKRTTAINAFMTSPDINVIIVSLKAGGLGLNLTAASRVYVMEPNFNPAAEAQAVERVHRLGQTRRVEIKKFVMSESIEEKVVVLQQKKLSLAEFSVERGTLEKFGKGQGREEAARQKLEDLKMLLR